MYVLWNWDIEPGANLAARITLESGELLPANTIGYGKVAYMQLNYESQNTIVFKLTRELLATQ